MATITRNEVASMLGVSVATVRRMEGKSLHPKLIDGAWRFELDEVKSIDRAPNSIVRRVPPEGEIAAEIFRRFDEGQSLRQIVREYRQPPNTVRALYRDWVLPLGGASVVDDAAERAAAARDDEELARWEADMLLMIATCDQDE